MENLVPTLFHEIYRKHFGATYDSSQIYLALVDQPTHMRLLRASLHQGRSAPCVCNHTQRPQAQDFQWMLEEYVYILSPLCVDDRDGLMVIGHELLLLELAGAVPKLQFKFIWCQQTLSLHFITCMWLVLLLLCCVMSQNKNVTRLAIAFNIMKDHNFH